MQAKKILFLGAAIFQLPPVEYALGRGYTCITCDNRPDNPGHKLAHKAYNISIVDKDAILEVAKLENIDGILTYGSDIASPTAAYVAEQLGLPSSPYESVSTMVNKDKFRRALEHADVFMPSFKVVNGKKDIAELKAFAEQVSLPLVIKPIDASGGRGMQMLHDLSQLDAALEFARSQSLQGRVLLEAYVERAGMQICGDGYVEQGKLCFVHYGNGWFLDNDSVAPYAETFPSEQGGQELRRLTQKINQVLDVIGYTRGLVNIDAFITKHGEPFIIEIGPRNGGNFLSMAIAKSTGVSLIAAAVESAIDHHYRFEAMPIGSAPIACYSLISQRAGRLESVQLDDSVLPHLVRRLDYIKPGDAVRAYQIGRDAFGHLIFKFDSPEQMHTLVQRMPELCRVHVS